MFIKDEIKLALVVPAYNEQEAISETTKRLLSLLDELVLNHLISKSSFIYFVDDGSSDSTFNLIRNENAKDKRVLATKFTRNFGNQNAILCGMLNAKKLGADAVVSIDCDLQQDENIIKDFILKYKEGYDIVFGVRESYKNVSFFKKITSSMFYSLMDILGAKIIRNHSEYRLVGKKALDILEKYKEYNLFLRSVFTEMGLKTTNVTYKIKERQFGKTKFSTKSLIRLAISGITSFSVIPLRFVAFLGILISLFSFLFGLEVVFEKYFLKTTVPGWTTLVVAICLFSGIQIFCLGIIGEYLGQIYLEVKNRPRYIEEEVIQ